MNERVLAAWDSALAFFVFAAAAFLIFGFLDPFSPQMPAPGLDPSSMLVQSHGLEHGFRWGLDLVFTSGPLAFLYNNLFEPNLYGFSLLVKGWIAIGVAGALLLSPRDRDQGILSHSGSDRDVSHQKPGPGARHMKAYGHPHPISTC